MAGVQVTDPKAAQCGEVLKGVLKPHQCKLFATRVHARTAGRRADGVVGGRLRGVLQLRPPARWSAHRARAAISSALTREAGHVAAL